MLYGAKPDGDTGPNNLYIAFLYTTDILEIRIRGASEANSTLSPAYTPDGNWVHILVTADATAQKWQAYINNSLAAEMTVTDLIPVAGDYEVGGRSDSTDYQMEFKGDIAFLYAFSSSLTPAEVELLYNEGSV